MIGYKKIFLDTAPFIYYIEGNEYNPNYCKKMRSFIKDNYENLAEFVTSVITIEEYLVFPYKNDNQILEDAFSRLISALDVEVFHINEEIAKKAARIRAEYKGFKAMDALQLAVACVTDCDIFLTNDKQLKQFKGVKCLTVDEL